MTRTRRNRNACRNPSTHPRVMDRARDSRAAGFPHDSAAGHGVINNPFWYSPFVAGIMHLRESNWFRFACGQVMSSSENHYLQQLRLQMELFDQLAKVRCEKNDIHDAKMSAWDAHRHKLASNGEFAAMWRSTELFKRTKALTEREEDILVQIERMKTRLEHLRYAGLDDAAA